MEGAEVKMLSTRKITQEEPRPYATAEDFCRIFKNDMNGLYLLSFLLTGNEAAAEKCFVRGLDDSGKSNRVFKEWADSWARRLIVQNAIQMIRPRPDGRASNGAHERSAADATALPAELAAIVELPAFERFAFVMSVLERHSDQECALLLDCTRGDVTAARTRALRAIGWSAEIRRKAGTAEPEQVPSQQVRFDQAKQDDPGLALELAAFARLAPSA
jgi:hypothetical protein